MHVKNKPVVNERLDYRVLHAELLTQVRPCLCGDGSGGSMEGGHLSMERAGGAWCT